MQLQIKECCFAGILCPFSQLILDTKKLIVPCNPIAGRIGNTLSRITAFVTIQKLMYFLDTGGCTGEDRGSAYDPALQNHFHFNSGVSPGIQNFSTNDILNDMIQRPDNLSYVNYKTISKVPAAIRTQPTMDLGVNCSCKISAASIIVITMLSLSMGTTLEASPN